MINKRKNPQAGERWKHWKGETYDIIAVGKIEATLEDCVIYKSDIHGLILVRPMSDFMGNNLQDNRFEEII